MNAPTYRDVLRQKKYRFLLSSNLVNRFGDAVDTLAFSWLVYAFTGEGMWAAIVFAVNKIPSVFFLPLSGAIVEKYEKKKVILLCDAIRCALVAALMGILLAGKLSLPILFSFTFLISTAEAFRMPASNSFITQLPGKELLDRSLVLNVIVSTAAEIAGTAAGGFVIGRLGVSAALLIDVISFVISIGLMLLIRHREEVSAALRQSNSLQIFKDGLFYMKNSPVLVHVIVVALLANAAMAPLDSLQTAAVVEVFHREADFLSLLNIALSVGMFVGGVIYPALRTRIRDRFLYLLSFLYLGVLYGSLAWFGHFGDRGPAFSLLLALAYLLYGFAAGFLATGLGLELVENTEQRYMARTTTLFSSVSSLATPVFSAAAGVLAGWMNLPALFLFCSVLIACGLLLCLPRMRKSAEKPAK